MKTLEQHNKDMRKYYNEQRETQHLSGVECDECKVEMHLKSPFLVTCSIPPMQEVICPKCKRGNIKLSKIEKIGYILKAENQLTHRIEFGFYFTLDSQRREEFELEVEKLIKAFTEEKTQEFNFELAVLLIPLLNFGNKLELSKILLESIHQQVKDHQKQHTGE